ncbi:hypothetical protein CHH83_01695 [Bacillus sp. 7586-K]|nr:hypothetical protein CHH83_01695 [Bacillus sp. 7586-K]
MKMVRTLTSKAVYYYSLTGKTEAIIDKIQSDDIFISKLNNTKPSEVSFAGYDTIIIGSSTYGRGVPPKYFLDILPQLRSIKNKRIGLFGSGQTIYGDYFCGALDVFEEMLSPRNEIIFKYKFEGYPSEKVFKELKQLILEA